MDAQCAAPAVGLSVHALGTRKGEWCGAEGMGEGGAGADTQCATLAVGPSVQALEARAGEWFGERCKCGLLVLCQELASTHLTAASCWPSLPLHSG